MWTGSPCGDSDGDRRDGSESGLWTACRPSLVEEDSELFDTVDSAWTRAFFHTGLGWPQGPTSSMLLEGEEHGDGAAATDSVLSRRSA